MPSTTTPACSNQTAETDIASMRPAANLGIHINSLARISRTNGKAERLIQTALREWAYAGHHVHPRNDRHLLPRFMLRRISRIPRKLATP